MYRINVKSPIHIDFITSSKKLSFDFNSIEYTIASFHQYIFFCMFCHFLSLSERHWLVRIEIVFFAATNNRLSLIRSCLNQFLSFWNGKDNMLMRIGSLAGIFNATGITESWMIRMWNNIPIVAIWTFKLVKTKIACVAKKQSFYVV